MDIIIIECVKCECCGLKEDCTKDYISDVKSKFQGKWLCGLCAEAVTDELRVNGSSSSGKKRINKEFGLEEAVKAHMSFCRKDKSKNPAFYVADGMRQMLRRRSGDLSSPSSSSPPNSSSSSPSKKYSRSLSTSHAVRM